MQLHIWGMSEAMHHKQSKVALTIWNEHGQTVCHMSPQASLGQEPSDNLWFMYLGNGVAVFSRTFYSYLVRELELNVDVMA